MIMNYFLICYADFIQDQPTRTTVGKAMIATISLNLVVNFSFILFDAIKPLYYKLRLKYFKEKHARLKAKITEREF